MTENIMDFLGEIIWIVGGILVVFVFALALALPQIARVRPGSGGHRPEADERLHEEVRPDGYIDSFANEIQEAGGGLPPVMKLAIPGVLIWWLVYLILNWAPASGG